MHRLSMIQALSLWSELERTLRRENHFGGDVAEVYVHRLMPMSNLVVKYLEGTGGSICQEEGRKTVREANESLHNLLVYFAKERDARIEFEEREGFIELGEWLKTSDNAHRWHIRIRSRKEKKSVDKPALKHLLDITPDDAMPRGNWSGKLDERLEERKLDGLSRITFRPEDVNGQKIVRVYAIE